MGNGDQILAVDIFGAGAGEYIAISGRIQDNTGFNSLEALFTKGHHTTDRLPFRQCAGAPAM